MTKQLNESMGRLRNGKKLEDYDVVYDLDGTKIDMVKLLDEQQRAKAALVHIMPFFNAFVNKLKFVYTFQVETQATDGYYLFVNPRFTSELDLTGKVFVMAHEIMHCVLNHMRRGKSHDRWKSNVAADYEVNDTLVEMGLFKESHISKLGGLYDKKYTDWGYEAIYDSNPKGPENKSMQNPNGKNGQKGRGGQGGGSSQPKSADWKAGWKQAIEDYKSGKLKL